MTTKDLVKFYMTHGFGNMGEVICDIANVSPNDIKLWLNNVDEDVTSSEILKIRFKIDNVVTRLRENYLTKVAARSVHSVEAVWDSLLHDHIHDPTASSLIGSVCIGDSHDFSRSSCKKRFTEWYRQAPYNLIINYDVKHCELIKRTADKISNKKIVTKNISNLDLSVIYPDDVEYILNSYKIHWIGIAGAKGSGKDTFCVYLKKELLGSNHEVIVYRWAEPLKQAAHMLYGWSREDLEEYDFKEAVCPRWGIKPRDVLKDLSEEFLKKRDPHYILKYAAQHIANKLQYEVDVEKDVYILVPDTRFIPEVEFLRLFKEQFDNHDATMVRVNRAAADTTDTHVSEQRLPDGCIDHEIDNNGHLGDLRRAAQGLAGVIRKKTPPVKKPIYLSASEVDTLLHAIAIHMFNIKDNRQHHNSSEEYKKESDKQLGDLACLRSRLGEIK